MPQSSSQNDLTIRLAAESELDAVAPLFIEFAQLFGPYEKTVEQVVRLLRKVVSDGGEFLIVVLSDGRAVGFLQQRYRYSAWEDACTAYIEDVFVLEEFQGAGIGRGLTERALERATERGCKSTSVYTSSGNRPAIALYEGLGFKSATSRYPESPSHYYSKEL